MTHAETVDLMTRIDRFQPAFAKWRDQEANALAASHGTTATVELRAMVGSFSRTLVNVTTDEASRALAAMEGGELAIPAYGQMALSIRSWSFEDRSGKRLAERYDEERERKYDCLTCQDSGIVEVLNPHFVEWFRTTFLNYRQNGFPPNWRGMAYGEWQRRDQGPLIHSAMCNCDCRRVRTMLAEQELFNKNERRLKGNILGPPACGMARYVPGRMPLSDGLLMLRDTLTRWYAEHEANETYEWNADAFEYPG